MSVSTIEKDINKYLKKLKVSPPKERIELHNYVGGLYTELGLYDEARSHHEDALEICQELGDLMGAALAYRHIGEAKAACGLFEEANGDVIKYYEIARKQNNIIEVQRALTTLGRVQLMQAQHMKDENWYHSEIKHVAMEAEKSFRQALKVTSSMRRKVDPKEIDQMYAGLQVNMGLVKELCGQREASIEALIEARDLYKRAKSKDELFRCLILLTSTFRQAKKMSEASKFAKEAVEVAKRATRRKLLLCEAYMELGLNQTTLRQFREARKWFKMAHREGSPNEEDQEKALRFRKISHLIMDTFNKLNQPGLDSASKKQCNERMADLLSKLGCFNLAATYYASALKEAIKIDEPTYKKARILFSLGQSYSDDGNLSDALRCYERELNWETDEKSRCQTVLRIAQITDLLGEDQSVVIDRYERALKASDRLLDMKYLVLENYLAYLKEKNCSPTRFRELSLIKQNLVKCNPQDDTSSPIDEDEDELEDEITNLDVDDYVSEEDDEDELEVLNRRRRPGTKFKPNEYGESPLHVASREGNVRRVKLLLQQGHELNPIDNKGWTPLHEACNWGCYEVAKILVEKGADVSNYGPDGLTPLHDAATNGHFDIMQLLMENKANVIAKTSAGLDVLDCLHDYKVRQGSKMSNRELDDYRKIENDVRDMMEKRGIDLIRDHSKRKQVDKEPRFHEPSPSTSTYIRPKPSLESLDSNIDLESEVVKDYRNTLRHLKRKVCSPVLETKSSKKKNSYVNCNIDQLPIVSTKEWLIDDVSRPSIRKTSKSRPILESDDDSNGSEVNFCERSDSSIEVLDTAPSRSISVDRSSPPQTSYQTKTSVHSKPTSIMDSIDDMIMLEDDYFDDPRVSSRTYRSIGSPTLTRDRVRGITPSVLECESRSSLLSSNNNSNQNIMVKNISDSKDKLFVYVHIEDNKLLIEIPDSKTSIKWLRATIEERYECLVGARADFSIAPMNDPTCIVSDQDTCNLFLGDHLVARIESWKLDSIQESYQKNCSKVVPNVEPKNCIVRELTKLDPKRRMELSYTHIPNSHIDPVVRSLARRPFKSFAMTGSSCFFTSQYFDLIMDTIRSCRELVNLELSCVGLLSSQFELICSKLSQECLKSINLRYNCIIYKAKQQMIEPLRSILNNNPKLKELDLRNNHIEFTIEPTIHGESGISFFHNLIEDLELSDNLKYSNVHIYASQQESYTIATVDY